MIRRPRLKSHLTAHVIDPHLAVLLSDVEHWTLDGRLYPRLIPLLDGTRSVAAIVEELRPYANIAEVHGALLILERSGYLSYADCEPPESPSPISVVSFGAATSVPAIQLLETLGFSVHADGDLTFALTDDYLRRDVIDFAETAQKTDRAWLPVKAIGTAVWIGPIVHPPATPCWHCLLDRVRANRPAHAWLESHGSLPARNLAGDAPASLLLALHAARTEMLKWAAQPTAYESRMTLITIDPATLRSANHIVVRQPGCRRCARTRAEQPHLEGVLGGPIVLQSQRRIRSADGGWRAVSPQETYRRYEHHISGITGIVRELRRSTPRSRSTDLYTAEHLFAPASGEPFLTGRRISAGKGISRMQARTSALCEALERYCGVFRGDETRIRASRENLGHAAVHPNACANFSDAQFDEREVWNARSSSCSWVPRCFDERCEIDWSPVWSLTEGSVKYLPTSYCYYGYPVRSEEEFCRADSNGCAAGNTLEEAILQGFLELVERDAVAIWWYNEILRPAVDLATLSQPFFRSTVAEYEAAGRLLCVFDLTTDLGIPSFAAVSDFPDPVGEGLILGFGAHFDAETALGRALTELNQWRSGFDLGVATTPFSEGTGTPGGFLRRTAAPTVRRLEDFEPATFGDIRDAVEACVDRAARCGLETLVLNQTREDVGLAVVKVVVPGLRHFWPRFGPGRLYTLPLALGWQPAVKGESQLNNFHLLI
jgi:oxazoline/thiazoline synthase